MKPRVPITTNIAVAFAFAAVVLSAYVAGERRPQAPAAVVASEAIPVATLEEAVAVQSAREVTAEEDELNKVRQAARDLIREKLPNAKIEGVFTLSFVQGGLYIAGADTITDKDSRRTYDMLVRLYTRRNGSTYWRAESLGPDQAATYLKQMQ
jgi:hypothetical protein